MNTIFKQDLTLLVSIFGMNCQTLVPNPQISAVLELRGSLTKLYILFFRMWTEVNHRPAAVFFYFFKEFLIKMVV